MKRKHPSRKEMQRSCDRVGPEDGVDPRYLFQASSGRAVGRKALQLCGQVAQTLSHVLAWDSGNDALSDVNIEAVVPAPNAGRLLVIVSVAADRPIGEVLQHLERCAGRLRTEVAQAIHRRRAPELSFDVVRRRE